MDEVLLGRPLLEALGLDAPTHLSVARENYNNMDCSEVPSMITGGKLTRLLLRGLFEPPEENNWNNSLVVGARSPLRKIVGATRQGDKPTFESEYGLLGTYEAKQWKRLRHLW
jgi:hypothetical protein